VSSPPDPASGPPGAGWRHRDHTRGSLGRSLFVLALPLVASGVLGSAVYQLFDLSFLARLGEAPLAAVVITNQTVRQVFFMLVMGLSFATQSLVARAVGGGDLERAERVAGQAIALGAGLSLVVAAVGLAFPEALFALPRPDPSFAEHGVPYVRLVFALNFGVVGTLLFGSVLGGAGDTTTPLLVQLVQAAVAIAAEWVLVFGHFGAPALGVRGVAIGLAIGQIGAMALGAWVLFRGKARVHLRRRHLAPDRRTMAEIVALAWPPALQMIGGVATSFAFIALAGRFGDHVQAAFAIALRVGMILPMICFPLAGAGATLVGQALGSGNVARAWRAVGIGLAAHCAIMWSASAGVIAFRHEIVALLSDDAAVRATGAEFLLFSGASFVFFGIYFVVLRALHGAGDFLVPMALSLGNALLLTIPLGYALAEGAGLGPQGIMWAQLASAAAVTAATGGWFLTGRWTRRVARSARR
jgi:putative MATE family efflux protein